MGILTFAGNEYAYPLDERVERYSAAFILLDNFPVAHFIHYIRILYGSQPVGDDQHCLASLYKSTWQKEIGYIPQTIYLSDDSIRNNIAFGIPKEEIDDAAVIEAIRKAQLSEFVENLPDGLEYSFANSVITFSVPPPAISGTTNTILFMLFYPS